MFESESWSKGGLNERSRFSLRFDPKCDLIGSLAVALIDWELSPVLQIDLEEFATGNRRRLQICLKWTRCESAALFAVYLDREAHISCSSFGSKRML